MCRPKTLPLLVVAALLAVPAAPGCGGGADPATTTAPADAAEITVYFAADDGALIGEPRPVPAGVAPLEAAVAELAAGPSAPALAPALPPGTRVLGARLESGVATVDLSAELETGYPAGSAGELALLGPLVRTASEAAGGAPVRILVEGRPPEPPGSQIDLSQPLSPGDVAAGG